MQVFSKISIFTILLLFKAYSVLAGDPKKIIFIFIDDLRPDIGIYGNDKIYTPTLDSLGKAGTVFENAYCQQALCSPSRSSILTGVRPDSIKVNDLSTHFRSSVPEIKTIPQFFKDKGYLSAGFGKIFHGKSLDDSLSWSNESYYPPRLLWVNESNLKIRDSLIALGSKLPYSYPYERGESEDNDDYRDGLITSKVIDYIRNHQSDSFFLALGYYKPHLPFSCPSKYWDIYDSINFSFDVPNNWPENSFDFVTSEFEELRNYFGIPATGRITDEKTILNLRQGYYACISFVDDQLRRLFNELRNLGLANDVTIVLVGDHGYKLGEYGSWAKHTNYGIDTRIPLMFTGPSIPAMKVPDVVEGIDIFPTLVDLYFDDFQDSNFEGQSLVPAFEDKGLSKDYAISQFPKSKYMGYSLFRNDYRLIVWNDFTNAETPSSIELYDHRTDKAETKNIYNPSDTTNVSLVKKLINGTCVEIRFPKKITGFGSNSSDLQIEIFNDVLKISLPVIGECDRSFNVLVHDIMGRVIFSGGGQTGYNINLKEIKGSVFFVKAIGGGHRSSSKYFITNL